MSYQTLPLACSNVFSPKFVGYARFMDGSCPLFVKLMHLRY
ncbi:hypothetical protein HanIR_Chr11g0529081 [Helianthus annuus]|nr:hypothetical protein HanIR_Chr11g0529081 [Helianthus annuus]